MNYSPKLKKAMQQIKNILDAEDIAGIVVLHTPGFSEYLNKLNPSYSCVFPERVPDPNGSGEMYEGYRIRVKADEVGVEKRTQLLNDTANMLVHLNDVASGLVVKNISVQELFESKIEILKDKGTGSSHNTQNN